MNTYLNTVLFLIIVFFTHVVQALAGFGGTMLAMPPSILLMGADTAKVVLNLAALFLCVLLLLREYRAVNVRELVKILAGMLIGMQIGMRLYEQFALDLLLKLYGVLILAIAIRHLLFPAKEERTLPMPVLVLVLLAAGVIHGMFVSGGALLVVYASAVLKEKREFRATVSAVWVVTDGYLLISQLRMGLFTAGNTRLGLMALVPLVFSIWLGNRLHYRIRQEQFLKLTYILLIVSGGVALFG